MRHSIKINQFNFFTCNPGFYKKNEFAKIDTKCDNMSFVYQFGNAKIALRHYLGVCAFQFLCHANNFLLNERIIKWCEEELAITAKL